MIMVKWIANGSTAYGCGHDMHSRSIWVRGTLLIEAEWRMYASMNYGNIGSDNVLAPSTRQAIIWTNAGILLIRYRQVSLG